MSEQNDNKALTRSGLTLVWQTIKRLLNGKQDTLTFDDAPTSGSSNPVKSSALAAMFTEIDGKLGGKDIAFSISVSAWTGSGPYTATISNAAITANSGIEVFYDSGFESAVNASVTMQKSTGQITFSTSQMPSGVLSGYIRVLYGIEGATSESQFKKSNDWKIVSGTGTKALPLTYPATAKELLVVASISTDIMYAVTFPVPLDPWTSSSETTQNFYAGYYMSNTDNVGGSIGVDKSSNKVTLRYMYWRGTDAVNSVKFRVLYR